MPRKASYLIGWNRVTGRSRSYHNCADMTKFTVCLMLSVYSLRAQPNLPANQTIYQLTTRLSDDERKARELRDYIRANYTKHEFLIPMRDSVRLFTSVYTPKREGEL